MHQVRNHAKECLDAIHADVVARESGRDVMQRLVRYVEDTEGFEKRLKARADAVLIINSGLLDKARGYV